MYKNSKFTIILPAVVACSLVAGVLLGGLVFRNPHVSMGGCGDVSEYDLLCADERLIRQILTLLEP